MIGRYPLLVMSALLLAPIAGVRQVPEVGPTSGPTAQPQAAPAPAAPAAPTVYTARVVARYPHDPAAFTQGLLWHDGALYESTGREGESDIRRVDLATGEVLARRAIPAAQFGEGLALWKDTLISLTWRDGAIHRWRLADLAPLRSDDGFPFEGWGLATLGDALVESDGSATLRVLDPDDYRVRREIPVTIKGRPLRMLNELEVVDGLIYANVWMTGYIVAIDPATGAVRRVIDLRPLAAQVPRGDPDAVLNGIAWDPAGRRLFVTGKLWPTLYQIELEQTEGTVN